MSPPGTSNLLNTLEIASPCPASWDEMQGNDTVRFCSHCQLHVYNVSEMTAPAAEAFLREQLPKGRTCVRLYRRHDGTIITRDCPVGLAAVRAKLKRAVAGAFALAASLVATMFTGCSRSTEAKNGATPLSVMNRWMAPPEVKLPPPAPQVAQGGAPAPPPPWITEIGLRGTRTSVPYDRSRMMQEFRRDKPALPENQQPKSQSENSGSND